MNNFPTYLDSNGGLKQVRTAEDDAQLLNDINESRNWAKQNKNMTFEHDTVDKNNIVSALNHGLKNKYFQDYFKSKYAQPAQQSVQTQLPKSDKFDYDKFYQDWKGGNKPIVNAIMDNYQKPTPELTPEQAQKARTAAGLTDTLSSMAEIFAHAQGATIRPREGASSIQTTNDRLQAFQDKYKNDMLRYQTVKGNAELQDFNQRLNMDLDQRKEDRAAQIYASKMAAEEAKQKAAAEIKQKELNLRQKQIGIQASAQAENARHNRRAEQISAQDKNTTAQNKTVPVFINGQQHRLPSDLIDHVVNLAIQDGSADSIPILIKGEHDKMTTIKQPITTTTNITPLQKKAIFEKSYGKYLSVDNKGNIQINESQKPVNKGTSNFSLNGVKSR